MSIEVVTLLRFEILGAIGELESKDFLTEGNGDHKEELLSCFVVFSPRRPEI